MHRPIALDWFFYSICKSEAIWLVGLGNVLGQDYKGVNHGTKSTILQSNLCQFSFRNYIALKVFQIILFCPFNLSHKYWYFRTCSRIYHWMFVETIFSEVNCVYFLSSSSSSNFIETTPLKFCIHMVYVSSIWAVIIWVDWWWIWWTTAPCQRQRIHFHHREVPSGWSSSRWRVAPLQCDPATPLGLQLFLHQNSFSSLCLPSLSSLPPMFFALIYLLETLSVPMRSLGGV